MSGALQAIFQNQRSFFIPVGWIGVLNSTGSLATQGLGLAVDSSDNVYLEGFSNITSNSFALTAKYDSSGAIQWQRRLGGSFSENGNAIAIDSSSNVYIAGSTFGGSDHQSLVAKYNSSGAIQWQRTLSSSGQDFARGIAVDSSSNVYVCTESNSGNEDFIIAKYNSSGAIQWQTKIGSVIDAYGTSIKVDSSGNIYVTGVSSSVGTNDFYIAKLNSLGVIQWQNRLGNAGADDQAFSVAIDSSLNVYVCGSVVIDAQPELLLVKYNSSGTLQWQTRLRSASLTVQGREVVIDASNYIYVAGFSDDPFRQVYVIAKYDSSGAIQWQQYYYDISTAMAYSLTLDSSGNIYVVGKYNYTYQYFQITKLDSSGVIQWQKKLGSSIGAGSSYSIAIDSLNNLYVVGTWTYNSSIQIIKYNSSGVIQWQRQLSSSGQEEGNSISVKLLAE